MRFQVDHRIDTLGDNTLFLISKHLTLGCTITMQMLNEVTDILEGVIRSEQFADVINPLRVFFRGGIADLEFILQRTVRNHNRFLIEFGINDLLTLHDSIQRSKTLLPIDNNFLRRIIAMRVNTDGFFLVQRRAFPQHEIPDRIAAQHGIK